MSRPELPVVFRAELPTAIQYKPGDFIMTAHIVRFRENTMPKNQGARSAIFLTGFRMVESPYTVQELLSLLHGTEIKKAKASK